MTRYTWFIMLVGLLLLALVLTATLTRAGEPTSPFTGPRPFGTTTVLPGTTGPTYILPPTGGITTVLPSNGGVIVPVLPARQGLDYWYVAPTPQGSSLGSSGYGAVAVPGAGYVMPSW